MCVFYCLKLLIMQNNTHAFVCVKRKMGRIKRKITPNSSQPLLSFFLFLSLFFSVRVDIERTLRKNACPKAFSKIHGGRSARPRESERKRERRKREKERERNNKKRKDTHAHSLCQHCAGAMWRRGIARLGTAWITAAPPASRVVAHAIPRAPSIDNSQWRRRASFYARNLHSTKQLLGLNAALVENEYEHEFDAPLMRVMQKDEVKRVGPSRMAPGEPVSLTGRVVDISPTGAFLHLEPDPRPPATSLPQVSRNPSLNPILITLMPV